MMTLLGVGDDAIWRVVAVLEACTAAVLVDVMHLDSWAALLIVPGL